MHIDTDVLNTLYSFQPDDEPDFVSDIIRIYLQSANNNIAAMKDALLHNHTDQLMRASHTLKSSSANVGATALMEMCKELEQDCRRGHPCYASKQVENICAEYAEVSAYLTQRFLSA